MVELVVLLGQVVAVIGDQCRGVSASGLGYHVAEIVDLLDQRGLLGIGLGQFALSGIAGFGSLAQHRTDAGVGVLDKGTGVAVEVDRLLGVKEHVLARVDLQQEILKGTESDFAGHLGGLVGRHLVQMVCGHFGGALHHGLDQIVGIDNRSLTALHLAFGQFDHTVGEVLQILAPLEAEAVEQDGEHLEVIVLLVAHHIDHLVDGIIAETQFGRADILSHIYGGAVGAEQQFVVEAFAGKVGPDGAVLLAVHLALFQTFKHQLLAFEIGIGFVVDLVEIHAKFPVGLVKSGVYPGVHHLP